MVSFSSTRAACSMVFIEMLVMYAGLIQVRPIRIKAKAAMIYNNQKLKVRSFHMLTWLVEVNEADECGG